MRKVFMMVVVLTALALLGSCAVKTNQPPSTPSNPSPQNDADGVPVNIVLSWSASDPDGDPLKFDVYFGTTSNPPLVASDLTSSSYDPGTLDYLTTYYWKVVVKDDHGHTTQGPVWKFVTTDVEMIWKKTLGGSDWDVARSVIQTGDGGYIVVGGTYSNDGDVGGNHGYYDMWVVKLGY